MDNNTQPYLSIVVVSRNDDHGGDMSRRMQAFFEGIYRQSEKFPFPVEIVMVEWNPPVDSEPLASVLQKPGQCDSLSVRVITVPPEIHQRFKSSSYLRLHQMIAKNVGIRRSKGQFILCTNIDILFSDHLWQRLRKCNLDPNVLYRANRCDVPASIVEIAEPGARLEFCREHILEVFGLDSTRPWLMGSMLKRYRGRGYLSWWVNIIAFLGFKLFGARKMNASRLDLWACGDFTLMSRDAWHVIRGYAELDTYPAHIDSLAVASGIASGLKQYTFPPVMRGYHIYHDSGYETGTPEELIQRMMKRPGPDYGVVHNVMERMLDRGEPLQTNDPDWGFSNFDFTEVELNEN